MSDEIIKRLDGQMMMAGAPTFMTRSHWAAGGRHLVSCGDERTMWLVHGTTDCGQDSTDPDFPANLNYGIRSARIRLGADGETDEVLIACEPGTEGAGATFLGCVGGALIACYQTQWDPEPTNEQFAVRCGRLGDVPGEWTPTADLGWPMHPAARVSGGSFAVHLSEKDADPPAHRLALLDSTGLVDREIQLDVTAALRPLEGPTRVDGEWWMPATRDEGGAVILRADDGSGDTLTPIDVPALGSRPFSSLLTAEIEGGLAFAYSGVSEGVNDLYFGEIRPGGRLWARRVLSEAETGATHLLPYAGGWLVVLGIADPIAGDQQVAVLRLDGEATVLEEPTTIWRGTGGGAHAASVTENELWVVISQTVAGETQEYSLLRVLLPPAR